jgi:hypothetical protein
MRVLIACEESGVVRDAFRNKGHDAYSCDLQSTSNPTSSYAQYHTVGDVLPLLKQKWDLIIAHPPCTFLAVSGAGYFYDPNTKHLPMNQRPPHPRFPNRRQDQKDAVDFFLKFADVDCARICIENPIGIMSSIMKKIHPEFLKTIVQPWQFGHEASKTTCLWMKGLPALQHTKIVGKGEFFVGKNGYKNPIWNFKNLNLSKEDRQRESSKTFQGIADAMAAQWGDEKKLKEFDDTQLFEKFYS